jgi:hypothetical protein
MKPTYVALISTLALGLAANLVHAQSPAIVIPAGTDVFDPSQ